MVSGATPETTRVTRVLPSPNRAPRGVEPVDVRKVFSIHAPATMHLEHFE
jgi:hypothetical protein